MVFSYLASDQAQAWLFSSEEEAMTALRAAAYLAIKCGGWEPKKE